MLEVFVIFLLFGQRGSGPLESVTSNASIDRSNWAPNKVRNLNVLRVMLIGLHRGDGTSEGQRGQLFQRALYIL